MNKVAGLWAYQQLNGNDFLIFIWIVDPLFGRWKKQQLLSLNTEYWDIVFNSTVSCDLTSFIPAIIRLWSEWNC